MCYRTCCKEEHTFITGRATAGIAITQQAILRFLASQGRHDWIFGGFRPKSAKNCQNFQLFRPEGANPLPNVDEIRRVYEGNRSTKAVNIWCDSVSKLGIYRQKPRWCIPPNFGSPLAQKLLVGLKKIKGEAKMVRTSSIFVQSLVEIPRCTAAWETKVGCFCFCLFVCLSRAGSWTEV